MSASRHDLRDDFFRASFAEFFAGAGLVRAALEPVGFRVVFANDIEPKKQRLYSLNFPSKEFVCGDIASLHGTAVPDIELATASFPCTDLSLAGNRKGLAGKHSGAFYELVRVLDEMRDRRPKVVLLENVLGFATSNSGDDLRVVLKSLNELGYACDMFTIDARWFVAQSRPRLFIVGSRDAIPVKSPNVEISKLRPRWLVEFMMSNPEIAFAPRKLPGVHGVISPLAAFVERMDYRDGRWWNAEKKYLFASSLAPRNAERLSQMQDSRKLTWATAYRRTRGGKAIWEIRDDGLAGCLRTTGGGSSKQAIIEAGRGAYRIRWMTGREYAALQGHKSFRFDLERENDAMFALGDAVCVPVVTWIGENYLRPLLRGSLEFGDVAQ